MITMKTNELCNNKKNKDTGEYDKFKIESVLLQFYLSRHSFHRIIES